MSVHVERKTIISETSIVTLGVSDYRNYKRLEIASTFGLMMLCGVLMLFSWWVLPFWALYQIREYYGSVFVAEHGEAMMLGAVTLGLCCVAMSALFGWLVEKRLKRLLKSILTRNGYSGNGSFRVKLK